MRRLALILLALSACHRTPDASTSSPPPAVDAGPTKAFVQSGDPSVISQTAEGEAQIQPTLAVTANNRVAVGWMSPPGERASVIGVRFSGDGGSTWSAVQTIRSPGNRTATDPVLSADVNGNIYLAWLAAGPDGAGGVANSHLYVARAEAGSSTLGHPIELSDEMHRGAKLNKPWLASTPSGAIVATWFFASSLGDGIAIARSPDGHEWTKGVLIERIGFPAKLPFTCSARHGNRAWVVYLDAEAGVRIRASDDDGVSWSPSRSATVSMSDERPRIAVDTPVCAGEGEDVTVAYGLAHEGSATLDAIVVARSFDGGRTFDNRRTLQGGATSLLHPQLAREPDGALDLAFYASGTAPEAGALRWVRTENDHSPLTTGKVVRSGFRLDPEADQRTSPGDYFGWTWQGGSLYAASIDNSGELPHVAFTRLPSK